MLSLVVEWQKTNMNGISKKVFIVVLTIFIISVAGLSQTTYTWAGANNASWATAANWSPSRVTPATNDILQFNAGNTRTITLVPTQTIGRFVMSNNTTVTLEGSASRILTVGNGAGTDLVIPAGSTLTLGTNINMTLASSSTADISGTLNINAGREFNTDGGTVATTVNGTIVNRGTLTCTTSTKLLFQAGSTYQHDLDGGDIPTATWNLTSNCNLTGLTGTLPTVATLNQSFGNFTWNCLGQSLNANLNNNMPLVNGTFTLISTGSGRIRPLGSVQYGNFVMSDGDFRLTQTGTNTMRVLGNFTMTGGDLRLTNNAGVTGILDVGGNFTHSGGTIRENGDGVGEIVFSRTGTQLYTSGGTLLNTINISVNSGSILQMGTGASPSIFSGSIGTFTLSSGATLGITSPDGITSSGATGNVQVTGTRTYSTGASYTYNGSGAQASGDGLPVAAITGNLTIASGSIVTATNAIIENSTITVNGTLIPGVSTQVMSGTGTLTGTGTVKVNRTAATADFSSQYTISNKTLSGLTVDYSVLTGAQIVSALTYGNVILSNTSGTNTLAGNVTVNGSMTTTAGGTLTVNNGQSLSVGGNLSNSGNLTISSTVASSGSLIVQGTSSGSVTYVRQMQNVAGNGNYHYFSSPVGGQTISGFQTTNSANLSQIWAWQETTGTWPVISAGNFVNGQGYNLSQKALSTGSFSFTGSVVNSTSIAATSPYANGYTARTTAADYNTTASWSLGRSWANYGGGGWNLLGNPFTSALDAAAFLATNAGKFDPSYVALYVYDALNNVYKYAAPSGPVYPIGSSLRECRAGRAGILCTGLI